MTTEENKAIVRRYVEAHAANDQAALKEVLAPDPVAHRASSTDSLNREALLQGISMFSAAFSDRQFTMEDQIAEGDKVMTRYTWRGTHSGDFQGLPPTGKQVAISAFFVQRIQEGKIVEFWHLFDQLALMQQLGLVPPPQPTR